MSLREYERKRDFQKTAEPRGKKAAAAIAKKSEHRFVVQKHDASRLHYDFRLEIEGTLKSWAVPKGFPFAKGERHLAVHVEDHPVEYGGFEGIIPKGQYGGGTVMLWDHGTFQIMGDWTPAKSLAEGRLHLMLAGQKLRGEWSLVQMKGGDEWLLLKSGETVKPVPRTKEERSVLSGQTFAEIAQAQGATWHSNQSTAIKSAIKSGKTKAKAKAAPALDFVEPMKAKLVTTPPRVGDWHYELKFDGYRALAIKEGGSVRLYSRNAKDFTARFADLAEAVAQLPGERLIVDGEIVALDDQGRSSFQLLQGSALSAEKPPLAFYAFDLLHQNGENLIAKTLDDRRKRLAALITPASEPVRFSADLGTDAVALLREVERLGLEGVIGKQAGSAYEIGRRSDHWIKLKCLAEQEFVIGGYTPPEGTRRHFGALLLGTYEKGALQYCGKVGTGFDHKLLTMLHGRLQALERTDCPFANLPEKKAPGRWSQTITAAEMKRCHWAEPQLVCQVRYAEWTDDGKLRHPVFLGLREDKAAEEVTRERPAEMPARAKSG